MKPKSAKYLARAKAFCEAVDLAVAIRSAPPWEDKRDVEHYLWCKERAMPPYKDPVIATFEGWQSWRTIFMRRGTRAAGKMLSASGNLSLNADSPSRGRTSYAMP